MSGSREVALRPVRTTATLSQPQRAAKGSDTMANRRASLKAAALGLALTAAATLPASAQSAKAQLMNGGGQDAGIAALTQTPTGVLIAIAVKGVPAGEHAMHIHAVGKCEPP